MTRYIARRYRGPLIPPPMGKQPIKAKSLMPYETICQISDFLEQFSEDWIGGDETGGWGYEPEKVEQLLAYAAMLLEKLKEAAAHE